MSKIIVIIHGWSDDAQSFQPLAKYIRKHCTPSVKTIKLIDWLSMDDDISYTDLAEAFDQEWRHKELKRTPHSVDFVVHSTGALVLREWLTKYFKTPSKSPAHRILMLAPANYGSYLADEGKTFMGRVFKGGFGDTGKKLLDGLELASPYTQELSARDIFKGWFDPTKKHLVTTLIGNKGYGGLTNITYQDGSDGTVSIPCANPIPFEINATYTTDTDSYHLSTTPFSADTAFAVFDRYNHSSIAGKKRINPKLGEAIKRALSVTAETWPQHKQWIAQHSVIEREQYANLVFCVKDHLGQPVDRYFVLLSSWLKQGKLDKLEGIIDVHRLKTDPSRRSFIIDVGKLKKELKGSDLSLQVIADPTCPPEKTSERIAGYPAQQDIPAIRIAANQVDTYLAPGKTIFLNVSIPRLFHKVVTISENK
ncbi:esterase/lipase family protein [Rubritalea spongiae]|uniref:Esterase/lipase family protein n=1 Tax=Rubritalea spongiae TaxID=430797 RepID=A0ABW5E1B1_9BACT